ncbi:hypothetical protein DFJ74DRAFT_274260 [Hyaloraphidium curvatum]|nr:hypothetical protein DFJ74DRAFT_274260 [Hyaloraphidium curvatum]
MRRFRSRGICSGRGLALFALLLALPPAAAAPSSAFSFSVVFGDSFTDYFRMYARRGVPGPPFYAPGRRSNGPTWIERFTERTGVENLNMALEGAVTDQLVHGLCPESPVMGQTCREEVDEYLASHAAGMPGLQLRPSNVTGNLSTLVDPARPRILYLMACGAVDFITSFGWGCWDRNNSDRLPGLVVDSQFEMLEELYNKTGARDFLLVDLFPLWRGMSPPNEAATAMARFVNATNALQLSAAAAFRAAHPDAALEIVSWHESMTALYADPKNASWAPYFGPQGVNMLSPCMRGDPDSGGPVQLCDDPDGRFFYDGHFSRAGHRFLGDVGVRSFEKVERRRAEEVVATTVRPALSAADRGLGGPLAALLSITIGIAMFTIQ